MTALGTIIKTRFPGKRLAIDYIVQDDGAGPFIALWNAEVMGVPKPDDATLAQWAAAHVQKPPGKTEREEIADLKARVAALEAGRK